MRGDEPKEYMRAVLDPLSKHTSPNPEITVIMPVYNVELWLERAVHSIQNQTFQNFELILVDDGSSDSSGKLCDRIAQKDPRVQVIHQNNSGAASARNAALKKARGEYIYFMDSDDWCEPDMLDALYRVAFNNDLDLVITGFYIETYYRDDKFYREQRNAPNRIFLSRQDFREYAHKLFDAQLLYAPWNKLYRRSYLTENGIEFPPTFWDDLPFNLHVLHQVERVGSIDAHYYHFLRAREESENSRYRPDLYDKREEEHRWLNALYKDWGIDSQEIQEFLARRYAERLVGCIENITCKNCTLSSEEKYAEVARMISTPQAKDALAKAQPHTLILKAMLQPLKMQNPSLTLWECRVISWVKQNSTNLFARLKANR